MPAARHAKISPFTLRSVPLARECAPLQRSKTPPIVPAGGDQSSPAAFSASFIGAEASASVEERKAGQFKVPVEGEGGGDAVAAHEGEAEAIHKADGLISELIEQVERGSFVVFGRAKDGQFVPLLEESSGLHCG